MLSNIEQPIWVQTNNYMFKFAKLHGGSVRLFAILDLSGRGYGVVYADYYKFEFDWFFINDEHKRRFVTFVESLSPNDIFLKTKLERACEDAVLYLKNNKK